MKGRLEIKFKQSGVTFGSIGWDRRPGTAEEAADHNTVDTVRVVDSLAASILAVANIQAATDTSQVAGSLPSSAVAEGSTGALAAVATGKAVGSFRP